MTTNFEYLIMQMLIKNIQMKNVYIFIFRKIRFFLAFLFLLNITTLSQNFTASVDKTSVGLGENFELHFNVSTNNPNAVRNFKPPQLSNFFLLSGPNQSQSIQIINGAMSANLSFNYVLQGRNVGSVSIGQASVEIAGKEYKTQPISINIVRGSTQPRQTTPQSNQQVQNIAPDLSQDVFIKSSVDKSRVYQGEQLNLVFKLYLSNVGISNYSVSKMSGLKGFWTEEFDIGQQVTLNSEVMNGKQYKVGIIRKLALFPTQSGILEIDPIELNCILQVRTKRKKSNDPFEAFFGDDPFFNPYTNIEHKVRSQPLKITVDPLPTANLPDSFKGTVGKFDLESSLSKNNPKTNEPVTLRLKISGQGNIKLIQTPEISLPVDLEKYDPKITDNISKSPIISGSRTIDYLFIPRYPGEKKIAPIEFTYFDLNKKSYITLKSLEYVLNVEQGTQPLATSNVEKENMKLLGQDINFIKTSSSSFSRKGLRFYDTFGYYLLYLIPILCMFGILLYRKKIDKDQGDILGVKFRKANKIAINRLARAKKLMDSGDAIHFYDEISKAVWGFVSDKLKIKTADISIDEVVKNLESQQLDEKLILKTKGCLEMCEFSRFAPNSESSFEMAKVYSEAKDSIIEIERSFKI